MSDSRIILVTGLYNYYYHRTYAPILTVNPGANTGIGYELVRLLAEKGHIVYLGARNATAGKEAE